jgi:hypothetical protein
VFYLKNLRLILSLTTLATILFSYNVFASCPCDPDDPLDGGYHSLIAKDCPSCPDDLEDGYILISKDCPSCPDDPKDAYIV